MLRPSSLHDAIKGIWVGLVPHRIELFVWLALMGKINTRSKLAALGIIQSNCNICPLCMIEAESPEHLLLHCSVASQIWLWWIELWQISWVFPFSLKDAFSQWCWPKKSPFFKKVWSAVFFIILWTLWKERNQRIFTNQSSSIKIMKEMVLLRLGWWISGWKENFPYNPMDIMRNPACLQWSSNLEISKANHIGKNDVIWCPPASHTIKWNVDASVHTFKSRSAIGGVLRNHSGNFMCLFSSPIPFMEINSAEILAIFRAVKITSSNKDLKGVKLIIESDSKNAVLWCNSDCGGPWNLNFQLSFIRNARKGGLELMIVHRSRSANVVADSMAKQGLHRKSEFIAWM